MRRVKYFTMVANHENGRICNLVESGEAEFHQFGVGYEEFEAGPGNYSTAIIELDSGEVLSVPAERIKFIKKEGSGFGFSEPNLDFLSVRGE